MSGISGRSSSGQAIVFDDSANLDSFNRLRVTEPLTLFDSKLLHDKAPLFWDEQILGGTSTHSPVEAHVNMAVTASAGNFVIRQTKMSFNYQPGKGELIMMTATRFEAQSGVIKRVGFFYSVFTTPFNLTDGSFFESSGGAISVNMAKNSVITSVPQSQWNVDKMDGTGPSRVVADFSKAHIYVIDYEWLGTGRVRFGLVIDGQIFYVHHFNNANNLVGVWTSSPNNHIRYEIRSTGGAGELNQICSTVVSEGGQDKNGILRTHSNGSTFVSIANTGVTFPLLGIRLQSAKNNIVIVEEAVSILCGTANDPFRWFLCINPTIVGTFTFTDLANSAVQVATGTAANTITDTGVIFEQGYVYSQATFDIPLRSALRIGHTISGVMDTLVLGITTLSGNADYVGSLTWRELL